MSEQKRRAVIWAAVSSEPQAERVSLDQQIAEARVWCEQAGYTVAHVLRVDGHTRKYIEYADAARDMEAYRRLRELLDARAFDVLVARSPDRLGREGALIWQVVAYCREAGASVHFLNLPMTGNASVDAYLLGIGSASAQNEVRELVRRSREGLDGRVYRGLPVASRLPFPYFRTQTDPNTGRPTGPAALDAAGARALREVHRMLQQGQSVAACARYLTALGFRTATGNPWPAPTLAVLLRNPFLAGKVVRRRWRFVQENGRERRVELSPEEWLVADGQHEAVFTWEEWQNMQRLLDSRSNRRRGRPSGSQYGLWAGLLVCDYCGCRMAVALSQRRNRDFYDVGYHCNGYRHNKCAHSNYVSERAFLETLLADLPAWLSRWQAEVEQRLAAQATEPDADRPDYAAELAEIARRQQAAYMAFEDGVLTFAAYKARHRELEAQRRVVEQQRANALSAQAAAQAEQERVRLVRELLPELPGLLDEPDKTEANAVLRRAFQEMRVRDKRLVAVR